MKKLREANHGEVIFREVTQIPASATNANAKGYFVVGESETVGNDHRLEIKEDTEVYLDEHGQIYIENKSDTNIYCPHEKRHDKMTLPSSYWKVVIAQEYDYIAQEKRNVTD